eukprot:839676-Rhodomonas_salina.1
MFYIQVPKEFSIPKTNVPIVTGYVYFAKIGSTVKIGCSKNVQKRMSSLSVQYRTPVITLRWFESDDMYNLEACVHSIVAARRVCPRREFFWLSKEETDRVADAMQDCKRNLVRNSMSTKTTAKQGRCMVFEVWGESCKLSASEWYEQARSFREKIGFVRCIEWEQRRLVVVGLIRNSMYSTILHYLDHACQLCSNECQQAIFSSLSTTTSSVFVAPGGNACYHQYHAMGQWEQLMQDNKRFREENWELHEKLERLEKRTRLCVTETK